jgi:hypothetical protein
MQSFHPLMHMLSYLILGVSRLTLAQVLPKQVCLQPPVVVYCFPYLGCGKVKQLLLVILGFFLDAMEKLGVQFEP